MQLLVPQYRQNLPKYIRLCEQNYAHINKLLPIDNFKGAQNKVLVGCFEFTLNSTRGITIYKFGVA